MAGLDEFDLIKRLFLPLTGNAAESLGLSDDVALIDGPRDMAWAVTADALVAGVHFFADDPPDLIARKLLRVNLSDLAAKSAVPHFAVMTCCFPRDVSADWLDRFASGLKEDCARYGLKVIGGDTVTSPGPLSLTLTALGAIPRGAALLRSNARSRDNIWVSGTLGDAALGLHLARGETYRLSSDHVDFLLDRYRLPQPRLELGLRLRGLAHAAMDVSDGLLGDLAHICKASRLGAEIILEQIPLSPAAQAALEAGVGDGMQTVISGGDDYEVLFTAPPDADAALRALSAELGLALTCIGRMGEGDRVILKTAQGETVPVTRASYQHFAGTAP